MPTIEPSRTGPRKGASPLGWALPYCALGFALAGLLQLEIIPVRRWLAPAALEAAAEAEASPTARSTEPPSPEPPSPEPPSPAHERAETAPFAMAVTDMASDPSTTFQSVGGFREPGKTRSEPATIADPRPEPLARRTESRKKRSAKKSSPRADTRRPTAERPAPKRPAPAPAPAGPAVARSAGTSCSAAIASYREEMKMGKSDTPADISAARYGAVLNRGTYFGHCGVPNAMRIHICAAVQNGVAVGVTVTTDPGSAAVASCIATAVRGLSFPSHPRMDVTQTTFE